MLYEFLQILGLYVQIFFWMFNILAGLNRFLTNFNYIIHHYRLDNKHVVFGQLLAGKHLFISERYSNKLLVFHLGLDVLRKIEKYGTKAGKPTEKLIISACGELLWEITK